MKVDSFLRDHPNVQFHFTPTYSLWLNQSENWFGNIERNVIARGVFTSTADLRQKLMRYIRRYNRNARPIRWSCFRFFTNRTPGTPGRLD